MPGTTATTGGSSPPPSVREVLVTGATSPLGRALAGRLRTDHPGARLTGLARREPGPPFDAWVRADLREPPPRLAPAFDLVVHAAAAVPRKARSPDDFDAVNHRGSAGLFRTLRLAPLAGVLNVSSTSVYEDSGPCIREDSAKTTSDPYGLSKLRFEEFLADEAAARDITVLSLRVPVLLVPGVEGNVVAKWLSALDRGEPLRLFHPGAPFNAVVGDGEMHAFASRYLARRPGGSVACNVASSEPIPVQEAARIVARAAGRKAEILELPPQRPAQRIEIRRAVALGFQPATTASCLAGFVERSTKSGMPIGHEEIP